MFGENCAALCVCVCVCGPRLNKCFSSANPCLNQMCAPFESIGIGNGWEEKIAQLAPCRLFILTSGCFSFEKVKKKLRK